MRQKVQVLIFSLMAFLTQHSRTTFLFTPMPIELSCVIWQLRAHSRTRGISWAAPSVTERENIDESSVTWRATMWKIRVTHLDSRHTRQGGRSPAAASEGPAAVCASPSHHRRCRRRRRFAGRRAGNRAPCSWDSTPLAGWLPGLPLTATHANVMTTRCHSRHDARSSHVGCSCLSLARAHTPHSRYRPPSPTDSELRTRRPLRHLWSRPTAHFPHYVTMSNRGAAETPERARSRARRDARNSNANLTIHIIFVIDTDEILLKTCQSWGNFRDDQRNFGGSEIIKKYRYYRVLI